MDDRDNQNDDDKGRGVDLAAWEGSPGRLPAQHTGANTYSAHFAHFAQHNAHITLHSKPYKRFTAMCTFFTIFISHSALYSGGSLVARFARGDHRHPWPP